MKELRILLAEDHKILREGLRMVLTKERNMELLQSGAGGYTLKQNASEELVRAIQQVAAGQGFLDPAITGQVAGMISSDARTPRLAAQKTDRPRPRCLALRGPRILVQGDRRTALDQYQDG